MGSEGGTATGGPREAQPHGVRGWHCHRRSEGGIATGGPGEAQPQEVRGRHCHRRSEGGIATGGLREAQPHEVQGSHSHNRFEEGNMMEVKYDGSSRATGEPGGDITRPVFTQ